MVQKGPEIGPVIPTVPVPVPCGWRGEVFYGIFWGFCCCRTFIVVAGLLLLSKVFLVVVARRLGCCCKSECFGKTGKRPLQWKSRVVWWRWNHPAPSMCAVFDK